MKACGKSFHDEAGEVVDCTEENLCRGCLRTRLEILRDQAVTALVPHFSIGKAAEVFSEMKLRGKRLTESLFIMSRVDEEIHRNTRLLPTERICKDGQVAVDAREFSLLSQHWQLWEKVGEDGRPEVEEARLEVIFALTDLYEKRDVADVPGKGGVG